MKKAIVLVSGGVDSSTVLAIVARKGYEIYALTFNYEQRHAIEISKIKEFVKQYDLKDHKIIDLNLRIIGGSALTDSNINVPKYNESELPQTIPITYVPARNTVFLSYALAYSEVIGANDIFLGVHASDSANYPDCRPEYLKSFEVMANLATVAGISGNKISIHAPLIDMLKSEIVAKGLELGVDFSKTISCYDPTETGLSCGSCLACRVRLDAFKKNNVIDPIGYKGERR